MDNISFHPVIQCSNGATIQLSTFATFDTVWAAQERALAVFAAVALSGAYQNRTSDRLVIVEINDAYRAEQRIVRVFDTRSAVWVDAPAPRPVPRREDPPAAPGINHSIPDGLRWVLAAREYCRASWVGWRRYLTVQSVDAMI